jgi:superoxide dismutase
MELHHSKHHQTYITNLNGLLKTQAEAVSTSDITSQVAIQQGIKFNAGGHINHSLFWQNLAPASSNEAKSSVAPELVKQIKATWGDEDKFKEAFNTALLGIQGSGWGWLVKIDMGKEQRLSIVTTKDQDPVVGKGEVPVFGVDMVSLRPLHLSTSMWLTRDAVGACVLSPVPKRQGRLRQEHLECHQLEDGGGALPRVARRRFQCAQGVHLSAELWSGHDEER